MGTRREAPRLTLRQVFEMADAAYEDDGLVLRASKTQRYKGWRQDVGDGLAIFVADELRETFDKGASRQRQLEEACRVMRRAQEQLMRVWRAFFDQQLKDGQADRAYTALGLSLVQSLPPIRKVGFTPPTAPAKPTKARFTRKKAKR